MKTIQLKQNDKELLKIICEQAPDGITIADVRRAIKLIDKIDAAGSTVALEDAEHQYLTAKFEGMKFVKADRTVLDLFDRLASAKE
jgi:hypothetical protein